MTTARIRPYTAGENFFGKPSNRKTLKPPRYHLDIAIFGGSQLNTHPRRVYNI